MGEEVLEIFQKKRVLATGKPHQNILIRLWLLKVINAYVITVPVFKIIQTPGLWEKDSQTSGVDLSNTGNSVVQGCSGYCSLT